MKVPGSLFILYLSVCLYGAQANVQDTAASTLVEKPDAPTAAATTGKATPAQPEAAPIKIEPASMAGNWMGLHPEWRGNLVFAADGTLVRPFFNTGEWKLIEEEGKTLLMLHWAGYGVEVLTAVSPDQFRGKVNRGEMRLHRIAPVLVPSKAKETDKEKAAAEALNELLKDSKWDLIDNKKFILHADGTVSNDFDESKGTWVFTPPNSLKIDVPWKPAPAQTVTTNCDATILRWNYDETILAIRQE